VGRGGYAKLRSCLLFTENRKYLLKGQNSEFQNIKEAYFRRSQSGMLERENGAIKSIKGQPLDTGKGRCPQEVKKEQRHAREK